MINKIIKHRPISRNAIKYIIRYGLVTKCVISLIFHKLFFYEDTPLGTIHEEIYAKGYGKECLCHTPVVIKYQRVLMDADQL